MSLSSSWAVSDARSWSSNVLNDNLQPWVASPLVALGERVVSQTLGALVSPRTKHGSTGIGRKVASNRLSQLTTQRKQKYFWVAWAFVLKHSLCLNDFNKTISICTFQFSPYLLVHWVLWKAYWLAWRHFASSCGLGVATPRVVFHRNVGARRGPGSFQKLVGAWVHGSWGSGVPKPNQRLLSRRRTWSWVSTPVFSCCFYVNLLIIQPFQLLCLGVCSTKAKRKKLAFGFCLCFPQPRRGTSQQGPGTSSHVTMVSSARCWAPVVQLAAWRRI